MHILLINNNPVVSRLISFCMRQDRMSLEEVQDAEALVRDSYDVVFVDEASYTEQTKETLTGLPVRKKVFLTSSSEAGEEERFFDTVVKKPFLPSQITTLIERLQEEDAWQTAAEGSPLFPLSGDGAKAENAENAGSAESRTPEEPIREASILDSNEIERIKALLDMKEEPREVSDEELQSRKVEVIKEQLIADGVEIVDEEEYVEALSKKPLLPKKKKKRSKKSKKTDEETFTFEEALLAAVKGMKVKKIKKLLEGAEVTININFKGRK